MLPTLAFLVVQAFVPVSQPAPAPPPPRLITQYKLQRWSDTDGLPQNSITSLAQTQDHYIWLGSEEGLIRFDGVSFRVFDRSNTAGITHSQMLALAAAPDGSLWIGTAGGGLLRRHAGTFTVADTLVGLPSMRVQAVAVDSTGSIWAGTNRGLWKGSAAGRGSVFSPLPGEPAFVSSADVTVLHADPAGAVWVGTKKGLARITAGRVQSFGPAEGFARDAEVTAIIGTGRRIWVGVNGGGVFEYRAGRFRQVDARLAGEAVTSLARDAEGALWIGTNGAGLRRLRDGRLESLGGTQGGGDLVWALLRAADGGLWVGTNGRGLLNLQSTPFIPFGTAEGLSGEITLAVLQARNGDRWIGTAGMGLNRITPDGRVTHYGEREGLVAQNILALAEMPNGDVLVGSANGSLSRFANGRFTAIGARYGLRESIMAIVPDGVGFWLGTKSGVRYVGDAAGPLIGRQQGLADDFVISMFRRADGVLWVGTRQGASRIVRGRVAQPGGEAALANVAVGAFYDPGDGSTWAATQGRGIARIAGDRAIFASTAHGLCDDMVHSIVPDGSGNVWMSTNRGIMRVARAALDEFFDGRADHIPCTLFDRAEGMRSRETNGGFTPAAARLADGGIMFPTMEGVVTVRPDLVANAPAPTGATLGFAVVGQDTIPLDSLQQLRVSGAGRDLEIHFTAPGFRGPDRLRFQFHLEGFDRAWRDAGNRRAAFYTNLPPGTYRFQVVSQNEEGVRSAQPAALTIIVPARYYETLPFLVLCAATLAFLAWLGHRARTATVRRRADQLKRIVQDRTRAQDRYRDLFDNASDMVFTTDTTGRIIAWNGQAAELTGCSPAEAVGAHIDSILPQIGAISDPTRRDITFSHRNGSPAAVEITTRAIHENGELAGYQVIGRDVYEWRRMHANLHHAARMEAVGQLAGGIAHDFNNLLTVVTSSSAIIDEELPADSPLRSDVHQISHAADSAARLTRQLLAFSRRQVLQPRVVDVNGTILKVVGMLRRVIGVNIAIETHLEPHAFRVVADPGQLEQVLMNLALNARDAMPDGGTLGFTTANLTIDEGDVSAPGIPGGHYVALVISDTGYGIDPAALPHLFEPFFTTKEVGQGTGLGLATVYGVVKQSGGHIFVDSEPGAGTRFRIYLPAGLLADDPEPPADEAEPEVARTSSTSILLVEDEPSVKRLAEKILTRRGFHVLTAERGDEALRLLERHGAVDLLLTDIVMPGMSGRELAQHVHLLFPGTRILYMSGYTEDEVIRNGALPEGEHFIPKPFTPVQLVEAVGNAVAAPV